ncbi:hypothetical protein DY000_02002904 [Brassica cretica]|uniref:Uncharacterized protein n=1 Tax=Brassica cretica TaxID=69181 RepID=A0ABQ7CE97_BRACR|nr:hypothetical protein DY000_02002904 [Brassica cretica]
MANCAWSELFPLIVVSISGLRALVIDPFSPCSIKQLSKREARFGLIEDCAKNQKSENWFNLTGLARSPNQSSPKQTGSEAKSSSGRRIRMLRVLE